MWIRDLVLFLTASLTMGMRPKIIGGKSISEGEAPFLVTILSCQDRANIPDLCFFICSGSLISPNVVMTAAHCVRPNQLYFSDTNTLYPPIDQLFVLVNPISNDLSDQPDIVAVSNVRYGNFATNLLFYFDGDIAILELARCIALVPGYIEFAKVATKESEPSYGCTKATTVGYGQMSQAPDAYEDYNNRARIMTNTVHSYETCSAAYIALSQGNARPVYEDIDLWDEYAIIPENIICQGGDDLKSVCFGDSGGPIFVPSPNGQSQQVIGITSFGHLSPLCTLGPDFSTRVAFYAEWIKDILTNEFALCSGWAVSDSFASWPINSWTDLSTQYTSTRCASDEWQCVSSECVSKSLLCNGEADCADSSDELWQYSDGTYFCDVTGVDFNSDLRATANISKPNQRVFGWRERGKLKQGERPAVVVNADTSSNSCLSAIQNVINSLAIVDSMDTVGDEWDMSPIVSACTSLYACKYLPSNISGDTDWVFANDMCTRFENLIDFRDTARMFMRTFNDRFNATCPATAIQANEAGKTVAVYASVLTLVVLNLPN